MLNRQFHVFPGQRCLETGVTEVNLQLRPEDMKKERMQTFIESIKNTGLLLEEPDQYKPYNPYYTKDREGKGVPVKPWTIIDDWKELNGFDVKENKYNECISTHFTEKWGVAVHCFW